MGAQSCGCIWVDDSYGPEFICETNPVARIEHKCGECNRVIKPGEKYERASGCWDGRLETHKTCGDCLSIRASFFCAGWAYGGLWEMLGDHINDTRGEISSECILPLTPDAREGVFELIEKAWEDRAQKERGNG
jgi:hypothetical protein